MIKEFNNVYKIVHTGQGSFKGVRMSPETAAAYLIHAYMYGRPVVLTLAAYDYPGCTDPVFWGFTVDTKFDSEVVSGGEFGDGTKFKCESLANLQEDTGESTAQAVARFIEECASTYQFTEKGYYTFKCTPKLAKWLNSD